MYIKSSECDVSKMEESIVIMKKDNNSLHVLNETASIIWENIENNSMDDIAKIILLKYTTASADTVVKDVNKIVNDFLEKGLLNIIE